MGHPRRTPARPAAGDEPGEDERRDEGRAADERAGHGRRLPGAHLVGMVDFGQPDPEHVDDTLIVIAGEPSVSTPSLDGPRNRDR